MGDVGDMATRAAPCEIDLRGWLTDRVAYYAELRAADIDAEVKLATYGVDSVYALAICGDIEDEFHLPVESTLVWEHDTIASLAGYLAGQLRTRS